MTDTERAIREIADDVYTTLGSGHNEVVYHRAMEVGLRIQKFKIQYESERVVELRYKGHYVGRGSADLIVGTGDDSTVVELKAVAESVGRPEEHQLRNYMKVLGIKAGLLIDFQQLGKSRKNAKGSRLEIVEVHLTEVPASPQT